MKIKAVLFDLDGTLLPQDQNVFVKAYFGALAECMAPYGYEPERLVQTVWKGTAAMMKNTGENTNEAVFWKVFTEEYGEDSLADKPLFDEFYKTGFNTVKDTCGFNPEVSGIVDRLSERFRLIVATNPIFPITASESRIRWAGLDPVQFELVTSYENSRYSKPSAGYYSDIAAFAGLHTEECLMVGNDVRDDMSAAAVGMKVFLLTDCLINKKDVDISLYPHGGFDDLIRYIDSL